MKFSVFLLLISFRALAANSSSVSQWNECALSYEQTKTSIFDVTNLSRGTESRMIFRNGKHFPTEAINIYYKGQYWRTPLEITDGFYSKKVARANLGADSFCLNYDLNWLRKDGYTLVPFNEKTCKSTSTLDFSVTTNSVAVLRVKIKKDAELRMACFEDILNPGQEFSCTPDSKSEDFAMLAKWNTSACEKLNDPQINKLIADRSKVLKEYPAQRNRPGASDKKDAVIINK